MTLEHLPLSTRMRPQLLEEFVGQSHILAPNQTLYNLIQTGRLHSLILWGPPGTGKTTLANLIANYAQADYVALSAVTSGVKDIRQVAEAAQARLPAQRTILFIDEIHRFNKGQQDALLPFVENGVLILIGATTENPSFHLNNALLSRARVYVLKRLTENELVNLINHTLQNTEKGLGQAAISLADELKLQLAAMADGDGRQCLNLLEILFAAAQAQDIHSIDEEFFKHVFVATPLRRFDNQGEYFYDLISALHKSVRGSDVNAALYWFARMIDGGCDPLYIARRAIRMAAEDIGLADPRALHLTITAMQSYECLGSPEGELMLAEAIAYLALAPKSNKMYLAYHAAQEAVQQEGTLEVPLHLRNSPTKLMKQLGYGKTYRYAHDEPHAVAAGENYFPEDLKRRHYYEPSERGLEKQIKEKIQFLAKLNKQQA
jgi:putative ATPase